MSKAEEKALNVYPIKIAEREGYDENLRERKGFVKGYHQAEKDVLDAIEKELTRRMLEDYNFGVEEDEIKRVAQGCMASLILFVRQMKEE